MSNTGDKRRLTDAANRPSGSKCPYPANRKLRSVSYSEVGLCLLAVGTVSTPQLAITDVGVEKVGAVLVVLGIEQRVASVLNTTSYEVAGTGDIGARLRNRTSRLMFWAVAARKNCSRTNFNLRSRSRLRPM